MFQKSFVYNVKDNKRSAIILSGRLRIKTAISGSVGGVLKSIIFIVDGANSDHIFLEKLVDVNTFLELDVSKRGGIPKPFILSNGDGTYTLTINDSIPETFNLKKPYKIQTSDIFTFSNFDMMISAKIFMMRTYVNYMLGIKLLTNTILYNKTIYDQYNINNTLQIKPDDKSVLHNTHGFKKWGSKKSETIDNIINILKSKYK